MSETSDPWSAITASTRTDTDNLRRVAASHPLEFWWGRDHQDRYLLVLDLAWDGAKSRFPELAGIEISSSRLDNGSQRVVLTLMEQQDRDIFLALCNDLLDATREVERGDSTRGLAIVLSRLSRWQGLFRRRRDRLSTQEIVGLWGELLFLRDCLLARFDPATAVSMWRGPYGEEQDFVVGRTIIEVKSQLSTSDHAIYVSSEHQLDTAASAVAIAHQVLAPAPSGSETARSLNALVAELRERVAGNVAAADGLDAGLASAGYAGLPAYDEPFWLLVSRDIFMVADGFPRIVPGSIEGGIERVRYHIRLEACMPFLSTEDALFAVTADG